MVSEPALGDFNYEHESTNQQTFGTVKFPTAWHSHQGWDDNFGFENVSAGHNAFGGHVREGRAEQLRRRRCRCPTSVRQRAVRRRRPVTVDKLADGVYLLGGGPANSVAVEFKTFVAVFEAPTSEARSLAVIEQIAKLMPDKPIRYLVNSHQHFDHIGGIRTYLHIGATIVTQRKNIAFLNRDVLNYRAAHGAARHGHAVAADRAGRGLQLRELQRELRHHRRHAHHATSTTCSRCGTPRAWRWRTCRRRRS